MNCVYCTDKGICLRDHLPCSPEYCVAYIDIEEF